MSSSRFLLYAGHLQRGGSYERARMLVRELLQHGCEVHYVGARLPQIEEHALLQIRVPKPPKFPKRSLRARIFYSVALPFRLFVLLLTHRYRALVVFDPRLSFFVWLPTRLLGIPTVLFLRSVPDHSSTGVPGKRRSLLGKYHDRLGAYFASKIIVTTASMRDELLKSHIKKPETLVLIPNGIIYPRSIVTVELGKGVHIWVGSAEWERWLEGFDERRSGVCERFDLNHKNFLIVTAGELTPEKNVEMLVRGVGAAELENVTLLVCGDGPEAQRIFGVAVSYGLSEQVLMLGWLKDPLEVIAGCDLYVSPSETVDVPNSVMEALGAGIPTIAGNTPAMRELLAHNELVYEHNHVGKLAERLRELVKGRGAYEEVRKLAHHRAKELDTNWGEGIGRFIREIN